MNVNERFMEFMKLNNIQPKEIAELFGNTKSSVSAIKHGKSLLTTAQLIIIAEKFKNLNLRWLITGSGDIYSGYAEKDNKIDVVQDYSTGCKMCFEKDKRIIDLELHRDDLRRQMELLCLELGKKKTA